jgi:hypothetical protein
VSEKIQGIVTREAFAPGSKSDRDAVMIRVDDGRKLLLRIKGNPAMGDPALDVLVGKNIVAEGFATPTTFIMERFCEGEAPRGGKKPPPR